MIEYLDANPGGYRPGVCNIGPAEIRRRRQVGWLGMAGTVGLTALLVLFDAPAAMRLMVALPAAAAFSGFIQAHLRFCAGFGSAGLQNVGELGHEQRVEDGEARAADRRRAIKIYAASIGAGLAVGMTVAMLPI